MNRDHPWTLVTCGTAGPGPSSSSGWKTPHTTLDWTPRAARHLGCGRDWTQWTDCPFDKNWIGQVLVPPDDHTDSLTRVGQHHVLETWELPD